MLAEEHKEFMKGLYPEGEERWLKVRYLDYEKCIKSIRFDNGLKDSLGFEFTAIGTTELYVPQINELVDLKKNIRNEILGEVVYRSGIDIPTTDAIMLVVENEIDSKIKEILNKYIINKP